MSTTVYDEVVSRLEDLSPEEQLRLMERLAGSLRRRIEGRTQHDIMELQGLGKEIWQGLDAQDYVDQERNSWNG